MKADDGKTLTFAAGTQSSLVVAEGAWFRKGATWCGPHGKEYEFEQAEIGVQRQAEWKGGRQEIDRRRDETCPDEARGKMCESGSFGERRS